MVNKELMTTILPFYLPEQYELLLQSVDDPEIFDKTWEEWYRKRQQFKKKIKSESGIEIREILVDVMELNSYCLMNGYKNNEATRIMFVNYLANLNKGIKL